MGISLIQSLLSKLFAEPAAEDMIVHYALSQLKTTSAVLLVTDPAMQPAYTALATKLRLFTDEQCLPVESDMQCIANREVLVVHSHFDVPLIKSIALQASHLVLVVEYLDTSLDATETIQALSAECGCAISFSYIEEGVGVRRNYSPTESHYLGHKIRRLASES